MRVQVGDNVILAGDIAGLVTQKAEFDTIFEYQTETGSTYWTDESLVEWNHTESEFASLDNHLHQDYT